MLLTEKAMTKWSSTTKEYYESLGYVYTHLYDEFEVNVSDLLGSSNVTIEYLCDYCKKQIVPVSYNVYTKRKNNNIIKKDCCKKCIGEKEREITEYKQQNHILKRNAKGYWEYKENRLKELKLYLEEHDSVDEMYKNEYWKPLYRTILSHGEFIEDYLKELGYTLPQIMLLKAFPTPKYLRNLDNIIERIQLYISTYNRFPTKMEAVKELKIDQTYIDKNGGINGLKKIMNYNDKNDLIDLRGDFNRSRKEYIVANYLFLQGFKNKYLREQHPFPKEEGEYRSDFTLIPEDETKKIIHIEVWGYDENQKSCICRQYYDKKEEKMKLYNKYINEIELISVDFDVFNKKYKEIQVELYKILQPYLKLKYKKIDYKLLIPTNTFSDDELFSEVMKYSPDNIRLPKTSDIDKMIHLEILKRFGSYKDFAKNFNKDTIVETTSWSDEKIFEILTQMTNEGIIINSKTTKRQYKGLNDAILKAGGLNKVKIKHFLNYKGDIPDDEMKWIIDISEGKTKTSAKINDEIINSAKLILKQRFTRAS